MRKKTLLLLIMSLCVIYYGQAQDWNVYDGSVLPDASDPAFIENTNTNPLPGWTIVDDPDIAGNKYLEMNSDGDGTAFWQRDQDPTPAAITIIARVQALDTSVYAKVIEFDTRFNPLRQKLVISNNGELELQRANSSKVTPEGLDVTKWHIYRYTFDLATGEAAVYLDEELVAVNTTITTNTSTDSYWRFGDGSGGNTYGAKIDWIVWDKTGAYSPSEQPLDLDLPGVRKRWALYDGDVIPDVNDPVFTEAPGANPPAWTIKDDPDIIDNKYLEMASDSTSGGTGTWRQIYGSSPGKITIVARVKALDISKYTNLVEFDVRLKTFREKLVIRGDNKIELQKSSGSVDVADHDASEWHIYRFTFDSTSLESAVYIDENNIAVNTGVTDAAEAAGVGDWRFGDGSGGNTYGALIDWIVWDTTGAYSPSEYPVYKDLPGADIEPVRNIIYVADLNNLDPRTGEAREKPFIDTLQGLGYNVTVRYDKNVHQLTETEFSVYNNADLVILGRSGNSGDFRNNNKAGWNRIKSPTMLVSPFAARNNRLNWFNSSTAPGIPAMSLDSIINAKIQLPADQVFGDVTIPGDSILGWFVGPYRYLGTADSVLEQSNGSNLAEIKFGDGVDNRSLLFGRFNTGIEFYTNAGDSAAGPRTYFGLGNDDTTYYNLTDDGLAIWLKEVEMMAGMNYTSLDFASPNAGLATLTINNIGVSGFDGGLYDYGYVVEGTTVPVVGATTIDAGATMEITQADAVDGTATVVVTAPDGVTKNTYSIVFESSTATGPKLLMVGDASANGGAGDQLIIDKFEEWGYRVSYFPQDDYRDFTPDHSEFRAIIFSESMSSQRTSVFVDAGYPIPALVLELAGIQESSSRLAIGDYTGVPLDGATQIGVTKMKVVNEQHALTKTIYTSGSVLDMYTDAARFQGGGTPFSTYNYTVLGEIDGYPDFDSWVAIEPSGALTQKMVLFGFFDEVAVTGTTDYWNIMERNMLWLLDSLVDDNPQLTGLEEMDNFNFVSYPNPSTGTSNVAFKINEDTKVNISVYNNMGQLVNVLTEEYYTKGEHLIEFNSSRYTNGMYLFKMTTEFRESMFKVLIEN